MLGIGPTRYSIEKAGAADLGNRSGGLISIRVVIRMTLEIEIEPARPEDLAELSRFLTEGFQTPADAEFAAPDVLRWKLFEPRGTGAGPRGFVARDGAGAIVGHVGMVPGRFEGPGLAAPVSTLHMIDWLGSRAPGQRAVGTALMRRAHQEAETQYVLVANARARRVTGASGYKPVAAVPVFRKVLRPRFRFPLSLPLQPGQALRAARDAARMVLDRGERPRATVALRRVEAFDAELGPILDDARSRAILNPHPPALLNAVLRYPRPGLSGWHVLAGGTLIGYALLNRAGKVVDCLLEGTDPDLWHAALTALTGELKAQGAEAAVAHGGTPWMAEALRRAGYRARHSLEFTLRDRQNLIPRGATFHLTPLETDDAF